MSVSRRRFLKHGALAAIACAVPAAAFNGRKQIDGDGSGDLGRNPLAHRTLSVNRDVFESLIGSPFKVTDKSGNGSSVWLRLTAVEELPQIAPANVGQMSVPPPHFSPTPTTSGYILSFSAGGTSLSQDTYIFENQQMGKFPMFIVPAGPGRYTALFNLINAPVQLAPSDDHPVPVFGGGPSSGAPSPAGSASGGAHAGTASGATHVPAATGGSTFSGAGAASPVGRPAQENLEPMFGDRVKVQMPE
jgi:hypothetical protein